MNDNQSVLPDRNVAPSSCYATAHWIREIGRGAKGARSLSYADAHELFNAIIGGKVSELELGAILIALRIKGESVDEIGGFLAAAQSSFPLLAAPGFDSMPVVIPSYNGARRVANLTPLLAMLLARTGMPVLMHGVTEDAGRVTSAEILKALGILPAGSIQEAERQLQQRLPVFMPIEILAPRLAQLLALRKKLGLRNSTHTLVKILQPFEQPALRLVSYTHPEYALILARFFTERPGADRGDVLLMRGTEGEAVANTRKGQQIDWFHGGQKTTLAETRTATDTVLPIPTDAQGTAQWIDAVLKGNEPVPSNIAEQVSYCVMAAGRRRESVA